MNSRLVWLGIGWLAAATAARAGSDWLRELAAGPGDGAADTGVVGMSAEDAEAYSEQESQVTAADQEVPESFIRNRRRFVMRELRINSDWDCDPTAVPAMVDQFKMRTGMDAQALLPRNPLTLDSPDLLDWPFVYLTAHYAFSLSEEEEKGLRTFIERGGFLYADDCLYGQTFGPCFQAALARIFPGNEFKALDLADPVQKLVYHQKYTFTQTHESGVPREYMNANPFLGMMSGGRVAVVYTPQDVGCQWEISSPPTPSNPLGVGMHSTDMLPLIRETAYRLGVNIIFYSMAH